MIVDLRIYTTLPNRLADFVALYEERPGRSSSGISAIASAGTPPSRAS